jgi:beta-N-acetylhexosaminidase
MSLRDLRRHVGRLAVVGFSGLSVPDDLRRLAAEFDLGGVVYFARNCTEPRQVAELSREVASLSRSWPLWISVDQEGGRVARLKRPFTEWPPMVTLGRSGDEHLVRRFASALSAELRAVGITVDWAPVLDVWTHADNRVIGDRALGNRPDDVARLGVALIHALQADGVAACGKHFPGHGDTVVDSHDELPVVEHERPRLDATELVPFRAAIAEGVAMIMTAHLLVPALDADRPASLSKLVMTDLLKRRLGFRGVVVSDDMGMKAVSTAQPLADTMVDAIEAGCDVALLCNSTVGEQVAALEAVIRAGEAGRLTAERIDDAFLRQQQVKSRFAPGPQDRRPPLAIVGSPEHQAIADEMATWL